VAANDLSQGAVLRIDPATGERVARISFQQRVSAIVAGEGSIWVDGPPAGQGQTEASFVGRIDPSSNEVVATIPIVDAGLLAAGEGAVWTNQLDKETVARIDPAVNEVAAQIDVGYVGAIAVGAGSVWAVTSAPDTLTLTRIDPATNAVAATIRLSVGFWDVAAGAEGVWASVF
jgi:streptogramin lyase